MIKNLQCFLQEISQKDFEIRVGILLVFYHSFVFHRKQFLNEILSSTTIELFQTV